MNRAVGSLMLSRILDALTPFQNQITFIVPLPHIIRIYSWSNLYMHAGLKLYTWSPLFALRYLAPFLVGGKAPNGDRSVFAGISASEQTIKDVQKAVEADVASDGSSLILMDAKDCDLVAP